MTRYIFLLLVFGFIQNSFAESKDYEGAQLFRLLTAVNPVNSTILNTLIQDFDGNIWKESIDFIDISFERHQLSSVKKFLTDIGINYEITIPNLQNLMNHGVSNNRAKRQTASMNWLDYQTYSTIKAWLNSLPTKYSTIAKVINIGTTIENRDLLVLRISSNVASNSAIWIDGGTHAREWISPASVTYIANYLLKNWSTLPATFTDKTWYIMPIVNPDGYNYSWTKDRLWRKNRKTFSSSSCVGVDLNRNFDIAWNSSSQSSDKCSDTYKGTTAFSENETNAVRTFLTTNKNLLKAVLTYHSYGQYITYPWGYTYSGEASNASSMKTVANTAATNIKTLTGSTYTAGRSTIFGLIAGPTDDWAKSALGTLYTYTIELRDTGNKGFLLPKTQIIATGNEALEVVKAVAKVT